MSKVITKVPVSESYSKAPASVIETIIGGLSIVAMMLSVIFATVGETGIGFLMFIGSITAYVALMIQRQR